MKMIQKKIIYEIDIERIFFPFMRFINMDDPEKKPKRKVGVRERFVSNVHVPPFLEYCIHEKDVPEISVFIDRDEPMAKIVYIHEICDHV